VAEEHLKARARRVVAGRNAYGESNGYDAESNGYDAEAARITSAVVVPDPTPTGASRLLAGS